MSAPPERQWRVYAGDVEILWLSDHPGPITSTAPPLAGIPAPTHPFLSAAARDAGHEDALRRLLASSPDLAAFLRALVGAGYRVDPV